MPELSLTEAFVRLLMAGALGAVIGVEREYRSKEAGYRTHFLVALGSALIMIVSQFGFTDFAGLPGYRLDPARVAAQVVSGIGFIGAGTIIFQRSIVRGLTTAAGIWTTCGIGLAVGVGLYSVGAAATVLTLVGLEVLTYFFSRFGWHSAVIEFSTTDRAALQQVTQQSLSMPYRVVSYEMEQQVLGDVITYNVRLHIRVKSVEEQRQFLLKLMQNKSFLVKSVG